MSTPSIIVCTKDMLTSGSYVKILQTRCGFIVHTAFNGADLLNLLDRQSYQVSLIITDVSLPGLNGFDLGDYIALKSGEHIPIIGVAEFPADEPILENSSEAFSMIMEKGFTAQELVEAVNSILSLGDTQGSGMTEEEIRSRAQSLNETQTQAIDTTGFHNFVQQYGANKNRHNMMKEITGKE